MNGFVNVLKPVGATASDIVVCIKHIFREKAGHLGTLDPGASGVLPVALGQATKLFDFLTNKTKYYRAFFTFGKTTDTLDSYGAVTETSSILPNTNDVSVALKHFCGKLNQVPPVFSAKSVNGVRAYKLARSGAQVELNPRTVTVYGIDLVSQMSSDTFVIDIRCSGGTYIRSLARDIAAHCGTVGYMSGLIRLQSGCFDMARAYTLDEVRELKENCLTDILFPLADVEDCVFPDVRYDDIDFGRKVKCPFDGGYRKVYCKNVFFGLGVNEGGYLKIKYYLKNIN